MKRRPKPTAENPAFAWLVPADSRSGVAHWWPVSVIFRTAKCGFRKSYWGDSRKGWISPGADFVKCKKCEAMK